MREKRVKKDKIASRVMFGLTILSGLIVFVMIAGLYLRARPIMAAQSFKDLIFSSSWRPSRGEFGFFPFIMGTMWVTMVAIAIALPLSLLVSLYLSEYMSSKPREVVRSLLDLLAGIPSVIYGVWGMLVIVPLIRRHIAPAMGIVSTGFSVLTAGIVLSVMILPVVIHVSLEVFSSVSAELREASLSLGATKWQTIKHVLVRKSMPGIIAAMVLGVSRAFGETMAVLMVAGNLARVPGSLFDPAYPLPALIANNYGEMLSIPLYDAALLFAALILLVVVLFFNVVSRFILHKVEGRI
ncbi:MAG: phosphate ABC transporter permease subunit PstC [Candidatus Omnitrophota bacterium]